jgi:hypothetical protein
MEPEGSLPHSQVPTNCLDPEPAQSSPYPHILLLEDQPIFCRQDDVSGFTEFTLLPKSATENGLSLVNWNFKK